ncbi:MAG: ABC transporter ATP-binding protein [Candidatus Vecturithrix sp.]|jgi:branched-chain amino acid transport system ATP-binding protein|nr:ABC transporter ATP-binding protein [Candidatus Vecturithrix sp.]
MIEVKDLHVSYGEFLAVKGVSFTVNEGELVTIIGANGAGKSTILMALMGLRICRQGQILFENSDITTLPAHLRARQGMALVPEGRRVLPDLTVEENLRIGGYIHKDHTIVTEELERNFTIFPRLKERARQISKTLSGGEQQMLAIARALMSRPKLLLMDEVSLGLMPKFVEETFRIIAELHQKGVTILLVEQNAKKALAVADRGYVLETGRIIHSATARELLDNPEVKKAYLGGA